MPSPISAMTAAPPDVLRAAQAADEARAPMLAAAGPQGKFSPTMVVELVDATNALLPLFSMQPYELEVEGVVNELPPDFVAILSMFDKASRDAELGGLPPLASVKTDTNMAVVLSALRALAKNRDFKDFLRESTQEAAMAKPKAMPKAAPVTPEMEGPGDDSMDALFRSRLRM